MEINKSNFINSTKLIIKWRKTDTIWMLSLYGTAIGAGILFLPINLGSNGLIPLIITTILALPMTYFSHIGLTRFVLSAKNPSNDITQVVEEQFGINMGRIINILYFLSIYIILLVYGISITNTVENFMIYQLKITPPPRIIVSFILIICMITILYFGKRIIIKAMSLLVFPFIATLLFLSFYLIPKWNFTSLRNLFSNCTTINFNETLITLWLTIPIIIFSFNHSPIISSFAVAKRKEYGEIAEKKCSMILIRAHIMMILTVMFFVFSCILSLSPSDLLIAKIQNISILSYLANHFNTPIINYIAPIITIIAITKSFFGHYLGAFEGFNGIIKSLHRKNKNIKLDELNKITTLFMLITTWIVATLNPSCFKMIEILDGPAIAVILFIIPIYAIYKAPVMYHKYNKYIIDLFIIIIGLIAISAIFYPFLWKNYLI